MKAIKSFKEKRGLFCTKCRCIICSMYRHNFVSCECGPNKGIFVDGGDDYFRFGGEGIEKGEYKEVIIRILEKQNEK